MDDQELHESEAAAEAPIQKVEPRHYGGWVFIFLIFGLLISRGLIGTFNQEQKAEKEFFTEQVALRQAVLIKKLSSFAPTAPSTTDSFKTVKENIADEAKTKTTAARIYLAAQQEMGERPDAAPLSLLLRSKDQEDRAISRLYASEKLTKSAAERLIQEIKREDFATELARVQAREKAEIPDSGRDALIPTWKAIALIIVLLGFLAVCGAGLITWVVFIALRSNGTIKALGFPVGDISRAKGDILAMRAVQIFGAYLVLGLVAGILVGNGVNGAVASLLPSIGVLVLVFAIQGLPVLGHRVTLADIGVNNGRFGKMLAWGFFGYLAELPLTLLMGMVGQRIFSFLPPPEHPASTLLQNRPELFVVVSVLVFGAMIAPFWEEIVFRGLLFPAVSRSTWGPVAGAFITSLIFAAIHPQGLSTWLALGSVAAVSCALAYHTKSLVPSITMHALHNLSLLVGTIIIF